MKPVDQRAQTNRPRPPLQTVVGVNKMQPGRLRGWRLKTIGAAGPVAAGMPVAVQLPVAVDCPKPVPQLEVVRFRVPL